jgi:hypothetical protein
LFVEFVKDNFSRLLRAIDRDPGMEIPVVANGVQKGISREMVDSLRSQLEEKGKALQKAEEDLLSQERQLGQEQADHRREKETAAIELAKVKNVSVALQKHHEEELRYVYLHPFSQICLLTAQAICALNIPELSRTTKDSWSTYKRVRKPTLIVRGEDWKPK